MLCHIREGLGVAWTSGCTMRAPHPQYLKIKNGAGEGARTLDIQLGKLMLYQLSYTRNRADLPRVLSGVNAIVVAMPENPAIM